MGFIKIDWVEWTNGNGFVQLGIGEAGDREYGYGGEALRLVLRYAFAEINLFRLSVMIPAYNQAALRLFTRAGFVEEVRRSEALQRNGRYWDFILLGLLREEWEAGTPGKMLHPQETPIWSGESSQKASVSDNLFHGSLVRLGMDNPEELANAFSRWRRDSEYYRLLEMDPVRLFSVKAFQKDFEANLEKKPFDDYLFTIHALDGDRLIGFVWLGGMDWNHGNGWVGIGLGERDYWGKGYGTDAMRVVLRYAFRELNLHRVSLNVFAYNPRAIRSYEKAGFQHEGRIRQALCRDGERADDVCMGILKDKWEGSE